MKKLLLIVVLCLAVVVPCAYGRGGGGYGGGGHGGRGGYRSGHYGGSVSYGWYGAGFFGGLYYEPWYFYGPPYDEPYALPPDYTYAEPAPEENYEQAFPETSGEWVEVPGQSVDGTWVPPHKVWVPDTNP